MALLSETLRSMPAVYAVISVLNTVFMTYICIFAVPAVFRVTLRLSLIHI